MAYSMNLKVLCPKLFGGACEVADQIVGYFPNLIHNTTVVRADVFTGVVQAWDIVPGIERALQPDWKQDIVLAIIHATVYFADLELYAAGSTLDYLVERGGVVRPYALRPKIGGYIVLDNVPRALQTDPRYYAKVGAEEILHYFGVPHQHDGACFFHPKPGDQQLDTEDHRKEYCARCLKFMAKLHEPLDFDRLVRAAQVMYGQGREHEGLWKRIAGRLLLRRFHASEGQ
jgi:predicted Zn-dependent protease